MNIGVVMGAWSKAGTAASLLIVFSALSMTSAQATAIQSQTFSATDSVTDAPGGSSTVHPNHVFATFTFNKFDTSLGVLTAVKLDLASTRTQTTVLSGTPPTGTGTRRNTAANAFSTVRFVAPGFAANVLSLSQNPSCGAGGTKPVACPSTTGPTSSVTNGTYTGSLSNFVGAGTIATTLRGSVSANDSVSGGTWTGASDNYTVAWSGSVDVEYSYQQHSNASFNSDTVDNNVLNINFGKVQQGSHAAPQLFDIFNMLVNDPNADGRLALNFYPGSTTASGDLATFSLNNWFNSVLDLAAGNGQAFSVSIDTSHTGTFSAVYTIGFVDSEDIAGIGYGSNMLTLDITGEVVPESETLALVGGGLLLLFGIFGIRRKAFSRP